LCSLKLGKSSPGCFAFLHILLAEALSTFFLDLSLQNIEKHFLIILDAGSKDQASGKVDVLLSSCLLVCKQLLLTVCSQSLFSIYKLEEKEVNSGDCP
jgi:hypothetical protein